MFSRRFSTSQMILFNSPIIRTLALLSFFLLATCCTNAQPLTEKDWSQVDQSVSRAVDWIVSTQQRDGSFPTVPHGQPAVTSFGVLAMLAQGELPDQGEHGQSLTRAIDYVLSTQKASGLLSNIGPRGKEISHNVNHTMGQTAVYNHAISALMLSEAYTTTSSERSQKMQRAIEQALRVTLAEQRRPKRRKVDRGGWRYLDQVNFESADADLSIIGWQLMFLRSAKNGGFDVPADAIEEAVGCIRRHFSQRTGRFNYYPNASFGSRAMTGAGILALAHAGLHNTPEAQQAGKSLLEFSFTEYNMPKPGLDRYHYSLFQCSQAAYQLGDDFWQRFSPPVFRTLLTNQNTNGSWDPEQTDHNDGQYGGIYTTSLVVLSLSAPNQLLPIFQR
ncbi:MAG: terpene cyclase/mutase family protein [Planctomycetes bacterium]|nr:terpene cyclase/mutase family protein [Planctomycetota bacterium]